MVPPKKKSTPHSGGGGGGVTDSFKKMQIGGATPISFHKFVARPKETIAPANVIMVNTNHLQVTQFSQKMAYHYDVKFTPDIRRPTIKKAWKLFKLANLQFSEKLAFDGLKNLYTSVQLEDKKLKFDIKLPSRKSNNNSSSSKSVVNKKKQPTTPQSLSAEGNKNKPIVATAILEEKNVPSTEATTGKGSSNKKKKGGAATTTTNVEQEEKEGGVKTTTNSSGEKVISVELVLANSIDLSLLGKYINGQYKLDEHVLMGIQVFDVVMGSPPWLIHETVGRKYFPDNCDKINLPGGLQLWSGLFSSVRPSQVGLTLNVNLAFSAFYAELPVSEYLRQIIYGIDFTKKLPDNIFKAADKALRRLKITVQYPGPRSRDYGVYKLVNIRPEDIKFECLLPTSPQKSTITKTTTGGGANKAAAAAVSGKQPPTKSMNVKAYYLERYGIRLTTQMPVIDVGKQGEPTFIPMELAILKPAQKYRGMLGDDQLREVIKVAARQPPELQREIFKKLEETLVIDSQKNTLMKEFGLSINKSFLTVKGSRVFPPELQFGRETVRVSNNGSWTNDRQLFTKPAIIKNGIGVINLSSRMQSPQIEQVMNEIMNKGRQRGIVLESPFSLNIVTITIFGRGAGPLTENGICNAYDVIRKAKKLQNNEHIGMLFFIMDSRNSISYDIIKRSCYTMIGVPSQVLLSKNLRVDDRGFNMFVANLLLKINTKSAAGNGINWQLSGRGVGGCLASRSKFFEKKFIVLGADVTHPSNEEACSIAAVVGTTNESGMRYESEVRSQIGRQETIGDMKNIIISLLTKYAKTNNSYPERMLFFRDGVSEGQFQIMIDTEIKAIREAEIEIKLKVPLKLTYVVVTKRHQTRFFGINSKDIDSKSQNLLPGFVLSEGITTPNDFDFYLQSQGGLKGTSRPTHYQVIYDDYGFGLSELSGVAFEFCHLYSRCSKSVKIPAPVYYAHHLCFRARHMISYKAQSISSLENKAKTIEEANMAAVLPLNPIAGDLERTMYFV